MKERTHIQVMTVIYTAPLLVNFLIFTHYGTANSTDIAAIFLALLIIVRTPQK